MTEVVLGVHTIAKKVESLNLTCRFCGASIRAGNVGWYEHSDGVPIRETFPNKAWVYFECSKCGYRWALWKLLKQAEMVETLR